MCGLAIIARDWPARPPTGRHAAIKPPNPKAAGDIWLLTGNSLRYSGRAGSPGPRFDQFRDELARYAVSVLSGWMYSGYVFQLAARRGFVLRPTAAELDEIHRDPRALRQELAVMIVAVALLAFREHALVGGGWRANGGASLTTYFLGACLTAFPNEFRKHRSQRQRWQAQDASGQKAAGSGRLPPAIPRT